MSLGHQLGMGGDGRPGFKAISHMKIRVSSLLGLLALSSVSLPRHLRYHPKTRQAYQAVHPPWNVDQNISDQPNKQEDITGKKPIESTTHKKQLLQYCAHLVLLKSPHFDGKLLQHRPQGNNVSQLLDSLNGKRVSTKRDKRKIPFGMALDMKWLLILMPRWYSCVRIHACMRASGKREREISSHYV